jgi:hypothetical protein
MKEPDSVMPASALVEKFARGEYDACYRYIVLSDEPQRVFKPGQTIYYGGYERGPFHESHGLMPPGYVRTTWARCGVVEEVAFAVGGGQSYRTKSIWLPPGALVFETRVDLDVHLNDLARLITRDEEERQAKWERSLLGRFCRWVSSKFGRAA